MHSGGKISTTTIIGSSFIVLLLYVGGFTTEDKENYKNYILNNKEVFAQENKPPPPIVKSSKIIDFSGINYADVLNSSEINLTSFTVSVWFNTSMNVTGRDVAFIVNKGGFGSDRPGFNLNYGIWLDNREKVTGGFEAATGDDYFIKSQAPYADGVWHNAILTYDEEQHLINLYIDGLEEANNSTNKGITPDNTGKQPVRLGANSFTDKGKIIGNYTGQLDDIQVWNYAFTKEHVASLFDTESKVPR
ncbi:MAG: LamG domain-containing protein [Nitrososphaeraceae archaeon]